MKNIFKKIAVVALAMIMCVGAAMPVTFAEDAKCPGEGKTHAVGNCDYKVVSQSEATCESGGFVTGMCKTCSATFVVNSTEKLGHDWEIGEVSCLVETKKTCKRCGDKQTVPGSATGHTFGEWITKGDKGCVIGNRRYRVCSACDYTEEQTMKENHSWIVAVYEAPVICTAPGKATYVCENSGCDATKTAELWAKAEDATHDYRDWNISKEHKDYKAVIALTNGKKDPNAAKLSCTKDGARTEICISCGETRVIYTPASEYNHTLDDMKYTDATLDVNGCNGSFKMPYWECYNCGIMFKDKTADADSKAEVQALNKLETFYAKYGTVSPVIKSAEYNALSTAEQAEYYEVYYQYEWKDPSWYETNEPTVIFKEGTGYNFAEITAAVTGWSVGHDKKTVAATCTTPGYEEINCKKCGKYSFKTLDALGHKYYADVTTDSVKKEVLKEFDISYSTLSTTWKAVGNVGKADGSGKIWQKVILPTCVDYAKVVWKCLNDEDCTETKTTALVDSRNKPCGHNFAEEEVQPATCLVGGLVDNVCRREVWSYSFKDGVKTYAPEKDDGAVLICGKTERKVVSALGHKWVKVGEATVTCKADGVQNYKCANAGCTETKEEEVLSTGTEHDWQYKYGYLTENTTPNCVAGVKAYAICEVCDMLEPQLVEKDALGHKFVEIDEEAMKLLKKKGYELYIDAAGELGTESSEGKVLVAEYLTEGSCVESAVYKVICQRDGCRVTSIVEPNKDNVKESHNIVVINSWYNADGVYDPDASGSAGDGNKVFTKLTCEDDSYGYLWYCKDKNCSAYRVEDLTIKDDVNLSKWVDKNGDLKAPNRFVFQATHTDSVTGEAITYKDVPDERISGADSPEEAQKIKAPVDENGNIIAVAIEIPGTSLVWRYVIDEVTCDMDAVEKGGFYCVTCKEYDGDDAAVVNNDDKRENFHKVTAGDAIPANCVAYGYTPLSCKNCDYTVQTAYVEMRESHEIDYTSPVSVTKVTCERSGANVYQCAYPDCRQFVTVVVAPLGHYNVSGVELLTSCLDPNAYIENRRCDNCKDIIFSVHNYVDGKCVDCGLVEAVTE